MNPFATRMSGNGWVVPVTALSLVLGFMVMTASITATNRSSRIDKLGSSQRIRVGTGTLDLQTEYASLSEEVTKLREENAKLGQALGSEDNSAKVLNDSLMEVKAFAGLTEIQGPGVVVTLNDSKRQPTGFGINQNIVHDLDITKMVNELFAAGAEAIDVNGLRVATTTSFRCAGPVIYCDGVRVAPPVVIRAIGDTNTLIGALGLPGGVVDEIRQGDPAMVQIEQAKDMSMAAYAGSTTRKFGKVPVAKK